MDNTQTPAAAPEQSVATEGSSASQAASTGAPVAKEDLAAFTAGLTREVADLVDRAETRAMLTAERRVLAVARRLVDEREQAACAQARSEQVIAELQTRLTRALADIGALKAQLDFVRAVAGAVPVTMTERPAPRGKPDVSGADAVQLGDVIQLSAARYLIRNPWRTDITGRPFIPSVMDVRNPE